MANPPEQGFEQADRCPLCEGAGFAPLPRRPWLARCARCELVFANPRPSEELISAHYAEAGTFEGWAADLRARRRMWRRRRARLRARIREGALYDVGAGIGEWLDAVRPFFTGGGCEPSSRAREKARSHFGLDLDRGGVAAAAAGAGSQDVVSLIHVLEHLREPRAALEACRRLLRPGGWLMCAVPNDGPLALHAQHRGTWRTCRELLRGRFRAAAEEAGYDLPELSLPGDGAQELHLLHFTPRTLRAMLEAAGFESVTIEGDPHFASRGRQEARDRVVHALYDGILRVRRLPLHPAMLAFARVP